jgi:FixJ family two-component response regulator
MHGTIKPICVFDDDSSVLSSLKELLASDGFGAETFDKPEEVLYYTQGHVVQLGLLDVWLPAMNGIEVQERLRELSPNTRVIIITARERRALRTLALERGAIAFLVKPFDDEVFLALVRSAFPRIATRTVTPDQKK